MRLHTAPALLLTALAGAAFGWCASGWMERPRPASADSDDVFRREVQATLDLILAQVATAAVVHAAPAATTHRQLADHEGDPQLRERLDEIARGVDGLRTLIVRSSAGSATGGGGVRARNAAAQNSNAVRDLIEEYGADQSQVVVVDGWFGADPQAVYTTFGKPERVDIAGDGRVEWAYRSSAGGTGRSRHVRVVFVGGVVNEIMIWP